MVSICIWSVAVFVKFRPITFGMLSAFNFLSAITKPVPSAKTEFEVEVVRSINNGIKPNERGIRVKFIKGKNIRVSDVLVNGREKCAMASFEALDESEWNLQLRLSAEHNHGIPNDQDFDADYPLSEYYREYDASADTLYLRSYVKRIDAGDGHPGNSLDMFVPPTCGLIIQRVDIVTADGFIYTYRFDNHVNGD